VPQQAFTFTTQTNI